MVGGAGYTLDLLCKTCVQSVSISRKLRPLVDQMYVTGVKTIPVTTLVAVFAGMILSLQTGIELRKFSQHTMIGNIVAISMCREMGPFITGLILAATVGSTMAAELGTMKVSEEIAALEVMSIDPIRFLVLPRVVALSLMCPVLTLFSDFIGIIGGAFVADTQLGVSFPLYWNNVRDSLSSSTSYLPKDVYTGLFKAWVFGITISVVGCSSGLRAAGGALGVGRAVQLAVVYSMLLIIILGYIITWFFYVLDPFPLW
ncbi:MAG: MlaE family ABC transporter permease [Planctomycetota bacterium]